MKIIKSKINNKIDDNNELESTEFSTVKNHSLCQLN